MVVENRGEFFFQESKKDIGRNVDVIWHLDQKLSLVLRSADVGSRRSMTRNGSVSSSWLLESNEVAGGRCERLFFRLGDAGCDGGEAG